MTSAKAYAKINLALVVGPLRGDGKHEVATVLQRIDICDTVELMPATIDGVVVEGFADTIVTRALERYADVSGTRARWHVRIDKRIPVAAGLGGGSSDAAAALRLANAHTSNRLSSAELSAVAAPIGSDVPFFLEAGARLASGDGSELSPLALPLEDVWVVLVFPDGERKESTAAVYRRFDERVGAAGFEDRRTALLSALEGIARPADLNALPGNDLASSHHAAELERLGALRAGVSGAGPAVYGLFEEKDVAERAANALRSCGWTRVARTVAGP